MADCRPRLAAPDTSAVVLLGCHEYDTLPPLPAVANNLEKLAEVLADPEVWGVRREDRLTVLSQPRRDTDVLQALRDAGDAAEDALMVYYAGHGLLDPVDDELYLALPDSRPAELHVASALRFEVLRRVFLDSPAKRKVLLLDCCYSGRAMAGEMAVRPAGRLPLVDVAGTCLVTASSENARALAPPGEPYTAFTGELLRALEHGVPGAGELLDMKTLYEHVYGELRAKSRPLPQQRSRNTADRICLARNRAPADAIPTRRPGGRGATPGLPLPVSWPRQHLAPPPPPPEDVWRRTGTQRPVHDARDSGVHWSRVPSPESSLDRAPSLQRTLRRLLDELLAVDRAPVTVLTGPRGAGTTAALAELARYGTELNVALTATGPWRAPEREPASVREMFTDFGLNHSIKNRPFPDFPRLDMARRALAAPIPRWSDRQGARGAMDQWLRMGAGLVEPKGVPPDPYAAMATMVSAMSAAQPERPGGPAEQPFQETLAWFGRLDCDGLDALVELGRGGDSGRVEQTLCRAFLADLRTFSRQVDTRYVLLLDNADAPVRAAFLDELVRERESGLADGLVVVAASGAALPAWSGPATRDEWEGRAPLSQAGYTESWPTSSWYPVVLGGLSEAETATFAGTPAPPVHRATGGHLGGTRLLLNAAYDTTCVAPPRRRRSHKRTVSDATPHQLRQALHMRSTGRADAGALDAAYFPAEGAPLLARPSVADDALYQLLRRDFTEAEVHTLTLIAGVWGPGFRWEDLRDEAGELLAGAEGLRERLRQRLWLEERVGSTVLHPWLRTLLLHQLAVERVEPADAANDGWMWAHAVGYDIGKRAGDDIRRCYHALAMGETHAVVRHLTTRWEKASPDVWLRECHAISAAPLRLATDFATPVSALEAMAEPARALNEPERTVWRLVLARSLLTDPLLDPAEELGPVLAGLLRDLGRRTPGGYLAFFNEAERYDA